jgi:hypothetical protein
MPGIVLPKREAGEGAGLVVGLGKVWADIFLGSGQGLAARAESLEGNRGDEVEADEGGEGKGNGDGDEIDVYG